MNNRYFVVQISTVNGATATAITEKNDLDAAKSLYHQILASCYITEGIEYFLVYIENEYGNRERMEMYSKDAPEPVEE